MAKGFETASNTFIILIFIELLFVYGIPVDFSGETSREKLKFLYALEPLYLLQLLLLSFYKYGLIFTYYSFKMLDNKNETSLIKLVQRHITYEDEQ